MIVKWKVDVNGKEYETKLDDNDLFNQYKYLLNLGYDEEEAMKELYDYVWNEVDFDFDLQINSIMDDDIIMKNITDVIERETNDRARSDR